MSDTSKFESPINPTDTLTEENLEHKKFVEKNNDKMWIHTFIHCYLNKESDKRFLFRHMYFPVPLPEKENVARFLYQKDQVFKEVPETEQNPDHVFYWNQFDPETMRKICLKKIQGLTEEMSDEELESNGVKE